MNRHPLLWCMLMIISCGDETPAETRAAASAREQALETAAREAAAAPLESQTPELQARYRQAEREARELMREHAKERVDELTRARARGPGGAAPTPAQVQDLDKALTLARGHMQRVEKGRGSEPPKVAVIAVGDAGAAR